jgi:hypothetical protein
MRAQENRPGGTVRWSATADITVLKVANDFRFIPGSTSHTVPTGTDFNAALFQAFHAGLPSLRPSETANRQEVPLRWRLPFDSRTRFHFSAIVRQAAHYRESRVANTTR